MQNRSDQSSVIPESPITLQNKKTTFGGEDKANFGTSYSMLSYRLRSQATSALQTLVEEEDETAEVTADIQQGSTARRLTPILQTTQQTMAQGNDISLMPRFNVGTDPYSWVERWERYMDIVKKIKPEELNAWFPLFLGEGMPTRWFSGLSTVQKNSWTEIRKAFIDNFVKSGTDRFTLMSKLSNRKQLPNESVQEFVADMQHQAHVHKLSDDILISYLVQNFHPHIQKDVINASPETLTDLINAARNSEAAHSISRASNPSQDTHIHAIVDTLRSEFGSLTEKVNQSLQSIASVHSKQQFRNITPQHQPPQNQSRHNRPQNRNNAYSQNKQKFTHKTFKCYSCTSPNHSRKDCPFYNAECYHCGRIGHIQKACLLLNKRQ